MVNFRIGQGYDVHQLGEGYEFWLGGIKLDYSKGAIGHSDADVLLHAICDALLGAANLRDIGFHFPDTAAAYKGIDSKILLKKVGELLASHKYQIGNIDTVICLQLPKVNPHIPAMQTAIANCLGITENQISIKATTTEKLGFVGREEGISAHASCLIYQN